MEDPVIKRGKTAIQSIVFEKQSWSRNEAYIWLKKHMFKPCEMIEEHSTLNYILRPVSIFHSFLSESLNNGIYIIIGTYCDY